jgi:hypothetical protein
MFVRDEVKPLDLLWTVGISFLRPLGFDPSLTD